eukprot:2557813-Rhodomonas_salina.3
MAKELEVQPACHNASSEASHLRTGHSQQNAPACSLSQETEETVERDPLTLAELRDGIQGDYDRMYLWTGSIPSTRVRSAMTDTEIDWSASRRH